MSKLRNNQSGFSAVETILVLVILALIGVVGWYVYSTNSKTSKILSEAGTQTASAKQTSPAAVNLSETYSNDEFGYSFQYPKTWKLTEDLTDTGRGIMDGDVYVASPYGTKVHFSPTGGGKGGDCFDDQTNTRTTRTCATKTILSAEKLSTSTSSNPVYFYHGTYTEPTSDGGKTMYYIDIENGDYAPKAHDSITGAIFLASQITTGKGSVTIKVEGTDDKYNDSDKFFSTKEVKEATPVLQSFKLNN
ncbi:MAG: hypothetical protein JWO35_219 [Candidatus Saccharibacteria bacterium]|nr:hypothetical protein [Candidatus Saccharibacteria bacterium]